MQSKAAVFDNFTIIMNSDIRESEWLNHIKAIDPKYIVNTRWNDNKTMIYNFRMPNACVLPVNILMKEAVVVVPDKCDFAAMFNSLISYLTCTIKAICPYSVANEMEFRLTIYISACHKDISFLSANCYLTKYKNMYSRTVLDDEYPYHMSRYELVFKFDSDWNVIENRKTIKNEPVQIGPCFRPVTSNSFSFMPEFSFTQSSNTQQQLSSSKFPF